MSDRNSLFSIVDGVLTKYYGSDADILVPDGVVSIGERAFSKNRSIESIKFPGTLVEIEESAFQGCSSLSTVVLNEGIQSIKRHAFFACRIDSIEIPNTVSFIGDGAFTSPPNHELTFICSKKSVAEEYAKKYGFIYALKPNNEKNITTSGIEKRLEHAYQASISSDGRTVYIPEGFETITCCFSRDLQIERVFFPKSVREIENYAFSGCHNLKEISFSEGIISIGKMAFYQCLLGEVVIPSSVEIIGEKSFQFCGSLKGLKLSGRLKSIGEEAFCGTGIEYLQCPEDLEEIGKSAFSTCNSLKEVVLSERMRYLQEKAFAYCNLDSLRIPGKDIQLGDNILFKNHGTKIYIKHRISNLSKKVFEGASGIVVITEDEMVLKELKCIDNLTTIKAPYEEEYDYRKHLKNGDIVPLALLPVSPIAYYLLQQNGFTSINQVIDAPDRLLPEKCFKGRDIKSEILIAVHKEREALRFMA